MSNRPKPDDRSDNVEKLQDMVQNTIENIEKAEETMQFASPEEREKIREKINAVKRRLRQCVPKLETKQRHVKTATNNNRRYGVTLYGWVAPFFYRAKRRIW